MAGAKEADHLPTHGKRAMGDAEFHALTGNRRCCLDASIKKYLGGKVIDGWANHETTVAKTATQVVKVDDTATKALQTQLATLQATVNAQSAQLSQRIVTRNQAVVVQKITDQKLPPTDLAKRWQALLSVSDGVTPTTDGNYAVTQNVALDTVTALEEVPALTQNVADLQTQLVNTQAVVQKQADVIAGQATQLADEKKSHTADVNAQKAKTRRAGLRGFEIGVVVGFIGGIFVGHAY